MNRNIFILILFVLFSRFVLSQCGTYTNTLVTYYASNNGQRGTMFDVTATNTATVNCFSANLYAGTTGYYEIYYKPGTYQGSESNAAAWTLVGSAAGVTSLGNNVGTPLPIAVNITIPAGQTYAFYITNDFGAGVSYTDGISATNPLGNDANLSITGGVGKSYPFGLTFTYREFNGEINYTPGIPLPISLVSFFATPLDNSVRLNWETNSEINNDYFTLERLEAGIDWITIGTIDGAGTTDSPQFYEFIDRPKTIGTNYYRLSQTDLDGQKEYFEIISVEQKPVITDKLTAHPNPASDRCVLSGSRDELNNIFVFDILGRNLTDQVNLNQSDNGIEIDFSNLDVPMVIIRTETASVLVKISN